ncbi:MAG TPA: hypothetical protein VGH80_00020 [Xanthomonadaceae bacterium]
MNTLGERKCALLLASLPRRERRRLLDRLPGASGAAIRKLIRELEAMRLPLTELAPALLADEVLGLTANTSLDLDQLLDLSERLPPPWFARVLSVWVGVDRDFCLATLDRKRATDVRRELDRLQTLPPSLVEALRAQALVMATAKKEAA